MSRLQGRSVAAQRTAAAALAAVLAAVLAGVFSAMLTFSPPARAESAAQTVEAALQAAREAARADRHTQAIAAFARAAQAAPERRREWLLEWADQHTWAGQLDTAMALYREAVAQLDGDGPLRARVGLARALSWAGRHDEALAEYTQVLAQAPRERQAQLGRATVLSWTDRQAAAQAQFEQALRDHPGDADAQRGLGRVLSWRGRHREAVAQLQAFLRERPHDREATRVLAETLDWMGRPERALPLLRRHVAADPGDTAAAALLHQLEQAQRPEFALDLRHFDQSDDLGVREVAASWRWTLADGRATLRPRFAQARYTPPSGPVTRILVQRPGLDARYRLSDALQWHGSLGLDLISTQGASGDHRRWTHDSYLTWWPGDRWRLDAATARWTFDSEETLRSGLTAQQFKLSADHLPDELTRLSAQVGRTRYSDGNRRQSLQFEAGRRWWQRPRVVAGLRVSHQAFSLPGQRGYYNPEQVRTAELTAQAGGWLPAGLYWEVKGALGRESERGQPTRPIRSASLALSWTLQPQLSLEAAVDHSTSRTLDSGGFARSIARLSLKYRP